jgi:proteasome-associated ATPase
MGPGLGNGPDEFRARRERDVTALLSQISYLEEEIGLLRRKVAESPRQLRLLEERLAEAEGRAAFLSERNDKLAGTLRDARDQLVTLKEEVDRLGQPPSGYGVFLTRHDDGTVDVFTGGRKLRVSVSPAVEVDGLRNGQEVMLNEAMNVVEACGFERAGDVVMLKELLEPVEGEAPRALVIGHTDEERVVHLAESLADQPLRSGDSLLLETRSGYVYERIPKSEVEELVLEVGCPGRSSRSATPSSCRSCTPTCSASTSCARPRASCSTARPAAARRSSPRRSPTRWPRRSPR